MKNKKYVFPLVLLVVCLSLFSCSNDDGEVNEIANPGISMKINGESWQSTAYGLLTEQREIEEIGDYYVVWINGQQMDLENNDATSSINLYLAVPVTQFDNPKGEYPLLAQSEAKIGQATALYVQNHDDGEEYYESMEPSNPKAIVGKVRINDFKTGELKVAGHSLGRMGYTMLSGTFEMNLHPFANSKSSPLKITDGKFNLKSSAGVNL